MLTILALVLIAWLVGFAEAAPMGTAWTYQGRLIDANSPADGLYDLQFRLFDDPCTGTQQAGTIEVNDLDVIDGYFTVELDFGSIFFNGDARWLEIGVRPGEFDDPSPYTPLISRQQITPVPYALQTRGLFVDSMGYVGIGNTSPDSRLDVTGQISAAALKGNAFVLDIDSHGDIEFMIDAVDNPALFAFFELFNGKGSNLWSVNENGDMRVTGDAFFDGDIGIGTYAPEQKLHVLGRIKISDADAAIHFDETGGGAGSDWLVGAFGGDFRIGQGNITTDNRFYIENGGNVGIGTTNPGAKLEIIQSTWPDIVKIGTDLSTNRLILSSGVAWASISGSTTNRDDIVIMHSNGNVGIGTTNPTSDLHVEGTIEVDDTIMADDASGLKFATDEGTTRLFIEDTGSVGIGTTTPGGKLDVQNSTELVSANVRNSSTSGTAYGINVLVTEAGGTNHYAGRFQASGATNNFAIYADGTNSKSYFGGNVGIETTTPSYTLHVVGSAAKTTGVYWTSISDRRLKKNIKPFEGALDRLTRLKGRTFEWKDPGDLNAGEGTHIGLVAQEVEEVFPQWVSEDNQGRKQVTLEGLEAVTIEAIKELKLENELLKDKIEALERIIEQHQLAVAKEVQ